MEFFAVFQNCDVFRPPFVAGPLAMLCEILIEKHKFNGLNAERACFCIVTAI